MPNDARSQLRWSYTSTISTTLLQVVAAATITRFVAPAEYGLVALAMLCCRFPSYLSQLGMNRAVIQKADLSEGNIRAAFTLSFGLGLAGCLTIVAMSPLLARFFHEPRLKAVLIVLSLSFVLWGFSLVSGGLLRRSLRMRQLAIADISSYVISTFAIGLPIAIKGYGAWAIIISAVSQALIATTFYFLACPHSVLPTFNRENYRHIVAFGGKATATTIMEGLGGSVDTLLLGKFSTAFNVGLYNRSYLLIQLPVINFSNGLTQVMFRKFAIASAEGSVDAFDLLARSQRVFLAVIFPLCAGAAAAASCIVLSLYGPVWTAAIPIYTILCCSAAADATGHLPAYQMEALGRFRHKMLVVFSYLVCAVAGIVLLIPHGLVAVCIALGVLQLIRSFGLSFYCAQYMKHSVGSILITWIPGLTAALPVGISIAIVAHFLRADLAAPQAVQLVACILTGLLVSAGFYGVFFRRSIFDPLIMILGIRNLWPAK